MMGNAGHIEVLEHMRAGLKMAGRRHSHLESLKRRRAALDAPIAALRAEDMAQSETLEIRSLSGEVQYVPAKPWKST